MSGVIFEATIKMAGENDWCIELKDTLDNRVKIANDLDEFEKAIDELGDDYGGHVDEVRWGKDDDVPEFIIDEIRILMVEKRAKIEEETGNHITPVAEKKEDNDKE